MQVIAALGRLPHPTEFARTQAAVERFGSLKRAFAVIRRITDAEGWESIARRRHAGGLGQAIARAEVCGQGTPVVDMQRDLPET